ncbi:MAG: aldehyde dehydrogenase family protein, partial [Elusimicrobia bacterium]|nr:aldehyde dehydrogenase family protein [Elusimicrobiota bacterium]
IILPDADLEMTIKEHIVGTLSYNGQRCTALKILFVHEKIKNQFIEKYVKALEIIKCGLPWEDGVQITPLPEPGKVEYLDGLVEDAKKHGAHVVNKNGGVYTKTLYYPAVLCPVNNKMRIYTEEQFGPVVPIVPFDSIEMPIKYIIESQYGQQVSIFGKDTNAISQLIDVLVNQVCRVNINSQCQRGPDTFPFTGRKDSAEGTLSVSDALKVFSIRSLVAAKENEANKEMINNIVRERKSKFLSTDFVL